MKILKDGAKILPKVGFHLWQFFFSRGGLPWCKDGAKGGLIAFRTGRTAKGGLFSFGGLITAKGRLISARGGLFLSDWLQRWASSFQRWAFPEYRPKVGFSSIFGQRWAYSAGSDPLQPRRYSGLPEVGFHLPKVGFSFDGAKMVPEVGLIQPYKPLFGQRWASIFGRWAFPCLTAKGGLKRLIFAFSPLVGFHRCKDTARGGLPSLQPRRYSGLPEVGFHLPGLAELPKVGFSFDGAKILPEVGLIQPYKPLFGQRWASIFGRWAFPCLTAKGRLKRLIFALFWAYFGLIWSFSPLVGFSFFLYTL